jgi:thioredoxin-related protein
MRFLSASLALTLLVGLPLRAENSASIEWKSFTAGLKSAKADGKYVFVDIYADWCGYCKKLDEVTFKAAPVISELSRNFVSVKVNSESEEPVIWNGKKMQARELVASWGVEGLPTIIFMNSKGEIVGSFPSYAEPDLMIKVLTYISSGARERKIKFDDYVKGTG